MTNGEKLKETFPNLRITILESYVQVMDEDYTFCNAYTLEWWNAEYTKMIGKWLRMSDLSEEEDNRYKCSRCGNVVHYNDKMDLYTFNSWCGRCGSYNGRKIEVNLYDDIQSEFIKQDEENIIDTFNQTTIGYRINKEELTKALKYERGEE